jgi:hypothetical protein
MTLRLPRPLRIALTIVCAAAFLAGGTMAHAQEKVRSVQLPWKGTDDEIVVNLAMGSLRDSLIEWLTTERGVHAETALVSIGAIAGFAAQYAVQERIKNRDFPGADKGMPGEDLGRFLAERKLVVPMRANATGEIYYFGDLVNGYMVQEATTVDAPLYGLLGSAAMEVGVKGEEFPDVEAMFARAARTAGTPDYGMLRPPKSLDPHYSPRQALDLFWPRVKYIFERTDGQGVVEGAKGRNVKPEYWPLATALVARQFLLMAEDLIDPRVSFALIMESAIVMSKVDPAKVPQGTPEAK